MTTPADAATLRERMVDHLISVGKLSTPRVAAAFNVVPRHLFVAHVLVPEAYQDDVIFTKTRDGISLSALPSPSISADILELLDVHPGHAVLEIGAGTGYNAALIAELNAPDGHVVTIDIDRDIAEAAQANLAASGHAGRVSVHCGDGGYGRAEHAPYDRVLATVGTWDIAPAWVEQLVVGGRLVLPLEIHDVHKLVTFERRPDRLVSLDVRDCRFVRMRGLFAGPEQQVPLHSSGSYLSATRTGLPYGTLAHAIEAGVTSEAAVPVPLAPAELLDAFRLWLALRTDDFCLVNLEGAALQRSPVRAWAKGSANFASAPGLLGGGSLCLVERDPDDQPVLRGYGLSTEPAELLAAMLREWHAAGRPFSTGLRMEAVPVGNGGAVLDESSGFVAAKRWYRYLLTPA
jgi:protein-L-isoaspartate(D-aspartate) O-methyltransferase